MQERKKPTFGEPAVETKPVSFERAVPEIAKQIEQVAAPAQAAAQQVGGKRYRICPNCGRGDCPSSREYTDAEYDKYWGPSSLGGILAGIGGRR